MVKNLVRWCKLFEVSQLQPQKRAQMISGKSVTLLKLVAVLKVAE